MTRILVVEDVQPNVEILKRLLSSKGYEVVVADNKSDAITVMNSEPVDLVLMDIGIPNKPGEVVNDNGGLETTELLKSNPATASIPIIAISAFAMLDEKQRFLDAGCNDVQSKPFDFGTLIQSIESHLSGSG
jgi:two-component system cell cycle response regulator DivK